MKHTLIALLFAISLMPMVAADHESPACNGIIIIDLDPSGESCQGSDDPNGHGGDGCNATITITLSGCTGGNGQDPGTGCVGAYKFIVYGCTGGNGCNSEGNCTAGGNDPNPIQTVWALAPVQTGYRIVMDFDPCHPIKYLEIC